MGNRQKFLRSSICSNFEQGKGLRFHVTLFLILLLPIDYLQQELPSVPVLSFLPPQQEHPQLQPHPDLPLIRYLIKAAIDSTKATFIKMHIEIACMGIVPLKISFMIFS